MATQRPNKPTASGASPARKGAGGARGAGGQGLADAAAVATKWLMNPEVQAQLLDVGMRLADKVKERTAERQSKISSRRSPSKGDPARRFQPALPAVSPQRRLERNTDKLADTVTLLRSAQGAASNEALDQVDVVIARVRLALAVAKNLPARRRISRQREIAAALRQVEDALTAATGLADLTGGTDLPADGEPGDPDDGTLSP